MYPLRKASHSALFVGCSNFTDSPVLTISNGDDDNKGVPSMSIVLRPYQYRDADRLRRSYQQGKRAPCYVAPCGAGKTILFSYICSGAVQKGNKVLTLSHRVELVDQISAALSAFGVEHSYIASGYQYRPKSEVYVSSVFTLARRLDLFTPDLIIIDECHHATAETWKTIIKRYPKARLLGVTATPCRTSGQGLDDIFDDLILGPSYEELTDAGFLTPLVLYAPPLVDTTGLHVRLGDYVQSEVVERSDRPQVTGDAIGHYKQHCGGKRAIVFDVSVESARKRAAAFREAGFSAECIDGTLAREVRAMAVADFRAGRVQVLTSCDLVSEGFDLPAIEVGIDLCPTQSLTKWRQKSGRVLRPMEGKSIAYYFDHARNWERHGLPTEPIDWTLAGVVKNSNSNKSQPSPRICPACLAVSKAFAKRCAACGEAFPINSRYVKEDKKGKLTEITPEEAAKRRQTRDRKQAQGRAVTKADLIELYLQRHGHDDLEKAGRWAQHILDARRSKGNYR
jgi:superfamily II DNA or RNA helicase